MTLELGVDATNLLRDRRGMGRYVRSLLREWLTKHRSKVVVNLLVPQLFPGTVAAKLREQLGRDDVPVRRRAASRAMDVVWVPWNGLTWLPRCPIVATIHDLWPFVSPAADPRNRMREQGPYRSSAERAQQIIAVSEFTKSEAIRYLDLAPDRIQVVPHGVSRFSEASRLPAKLQGIGRYVLFVGEAEERKDLPTLCAAMSRLPDELRHNTALVIAGRAVGPKPDVAPDLRVEVMGGVNDGELAALYSAAAAFVLPSRYEGFGMPVLEAMAYGAPVVASGASAIPEAAGDAALYFPSGDAGALRARLIEVLSDDAQAADLVVRGSRRVAAMTWARCAQRTLAVLEFAAARRAEQT